MLVGRHLCSDLSLFCCCPSRLHWHITERDFEVEVSSHLANDEYTEYFEQKGCKMNVKGTRSI